MIESEGYLQITDGKLAINELILLEKLSLTIRAGDRMLLLGPNGSGKSTLLSVLLGERPIQSGSLVSSFKRIGYVPQWKKVEFQYPLTVESLLRLAFPFPDLRSSTHRTQQLAIQTVLEKVHMADRKNRLLRECSGGELQRAFLARAFLLQPDLLLLDEPISAVDQKGRELILDMLRDYCATHNPAIVLTVHDHEPGWHEFFTRRVHIREGCLEEER